MRCFSHIICPWLVTNRFDLIILACLISITTSLVAIFFFFLGCVFGQESSNFKPIDDLNNYSPALCTTELDSLFVNCVGLHAAYKQLILAIKVESTFEFNSQLFFYIEERTFFFTCTDLQVKKIVGVSLSVQ